MDLATKKKEIIKWINSVENPFIIEQIDQINGPEKRLILRRNEWKELVFLMLEKKPLIL